MFHPKAALVLLHAPSVYDFRKLPILYGPISDIVPSTPLFEMYPIGFSSLSEYLSKEGFAVQIVNLAYRMLKDASFDVEEKIKRLHPMAFGIDLHWLPHAHGSLEVAKLCKEHHPDIPVILGGYASSYFHEELVRYPQVDFVVRGDSTEQPMALLMKRIQNGASMESVPNLTWMEGDRVQVNPLSYVPTDVDRLSNNYLHLFKSALGFMSLTDQTPIHDWWEYPISAIMTCRGCVHNCIFCGGCNSAVKGYCGRSRPAYRSPALIAQDIRGLSRYTNAPIFVVGDLRQAGEHYATSVLEGLRECKPRNAVVLELFTPAPKSYFETVSRCLPNFNFEMTPESHDEEVRHATGKFYSNEELESTIEWALESGCAKFDVFFSIGLPKQTPESAMESVEYLGYLMDKFDRRVSTFISPLAPFMDPGSPAYERSEELGYTIFFRTLEEHRRALLKPSWKYTLNYETKWMSRDEIVATTYRAALRLNELKKKGGVISREMFEEVKSKAQEAARLIEEIDSIMESDPSQVQERLRKIKDRIDQASMSTICEAEEIKWPVARKNFNFLKIGWDLIFK
jgi:B12-binding domain/radical SAM domain protein